MSRTRTAALLALLVTSACSGGGSSSGGAPAGTAATPPPQQVAPSAPAPGGACDTVDAQTGMENGTLICTDTGAGLVWTAMESPGQPAVGGDGAGASGGASGGDRVAGTPPAMRVGEACSTDGELGYGDGMVTICDGGSARYAMRDDVPPAPAGGATGRPEWYPTLAGIFGPEVDECTGGPVAFTHPVVDLAHLSRSMPAGMMIGDHVTPIDHMYLGVTSLDLPATERTPDDAAVVTAPAAGTVVEVSSLGSPESHRIVVVHGCGIVSVYMVVNQLTGVLAPYAAQVETDGFVRPDLAIAAGDELGRQLDNMVDFNIFDSSTWLPGFADPFSYANGEPWKPYTADPFPLFSPEIRSAMEANMQRTVEPRWGVIDRDVPGTAAGSWFLDGTMGYNGIAVDAAAAATAGLPGGALPGKTTYAFGHLSLAPHPVDEQAWILSTGWWQDPAGDPRQTVVRLAEGQPAPDQLTPADGVVVYELTSPTIVQPDGFTRPATENSLDGIGYLVVPGERVGWAVVQVVDDATIDVELVTDPAASPTGFTDAVRSYHR